MPADDSGGPDPDPHRSFFPESLCHDCAAPPRYIVNRRGSTFLFCPLFKRYPPQPVRACEKFVPRAAPGEPVAD